MLKRQGSSELRLSAGQIFVAFSGQGDSLGGTLVYAKDIALGSWDNGKKFVSITMSRPLEEQEQLDISQPGQDADQDHS